MMHYVYNRICSLCILLGVMYGMVACKSVSVNQTVGLSKFTIAQESLIMDGDSLSAMRVFKITNITDSILLRAKSERVIADPEDVVLRHLVSRLYYTMRDSLNMGVGISAPQVGILKRVIWVQRFDKEGLPFEAYLNPVINYYSDEKLPCREGCLSIPDRMDTTRVRARRIGIEYDLLSGLHQSETVEGFTSVIFQHEIDHLDGILYIDHLSKSE